MKVITVSDAWQPQVNGVVRTIEATNAELRKAGHQTIVIGPNEFVTAPCPGYGGIRLALFPYQRLARRLRTEIGDEGPGDVAVHIATEGPLGHAASRWCLGHDVPFSTAYHTRFPQYLEAYFRVPPRWTYALLRRFHRRSSVVLVPTRSVEAELRAQSLDNVALWSRGVDTGRFRPSAPFFVGLRRPVYLYVGRVSAEKSVDDFLKLDLKGSKVVAGEGPALSRLRQRFPEAHFLGLLAPEMLARLYSSADVLVFPSRTDTFGLVLLEALACGTPVAGYPVPGPLDVIGDAGVGVLDEDLRRASLQALRIDRAKCRAFAQEHSWEAATQQFIALQKPLRTPLADGRRASRADGLNSVPAPRV